MKETTARSPLQKAIAVALLLLTFTVSAFAAPTSLSTTVLVQNNAQVTAGQLAISFTACDNVNGNSFVSTGREVLLVQNSDGAAAHTFTATPVADPYGGTNTTLTSYSVAQSTFAAVQMKYQIGWVSGSTIVLACNSNLIKFAVLQYN